MLTEKLSVSFWILVYVVIGSGIDFLRVKKVDQYVLCFCGLTGLASGKVFHFIGTRFGDTAGFVAGFAVTALIMLVSRQFIKERIISKKREPISSITQEDKEWYEEFKKEVDREANEMQKADITRKMPQKRKRTKHKRRK